MPTQQIGQKKFIRNMGKDWINGYIFSWLETKYKDAIKYNADDFVLAVSIPKSWFGLQSVMDDSVRLSEEEVGDYINELEDIASVLCKKWRIKEAEMLPDQQYMTLHAIFVRKVKRLTKGQIEKLLGYEIEIVEG